MPVNYQGVIRDNQGLILVNEDVELRFTIIQGSPNGTAVYIEDHQEKTNQFGLVNIELGTGLVLGGDFYTIDWSLMNYYLKLEFQKKNGNGFSDLGTSKLNSVPFANYALNAGNVSYSDTSAINEIQVISLNANNLSLSNGGGVVDLSPYLDNTDNQSLTRTGNQITISGGNTINLPNDNVFDGDSSQTNELQAISFSNDTLTLSNGGKVYLGAYNNSQAILFNAQLITNLSNKQSTDSLLLFNLIQTNSNNIQGVGNQLFLLSQKVSSDSLLFQSQLNTHISQDNDLDSLNELQVLSISNDTIYLSKGGFVVLPIDEVNDADSNPTNELQILSLSNDTLTLSNGGFVVLPDNVDDADNNPTNEMQALSISNDTVFLSGGGFVKLPNDLTFDGDSSTSNELQSLSLSNDTLYLTNGGYIVLPPDGDNNPTNEIQALSISNDSIFLSNGGVVKLPLDQVNDGDFDNTNELQFLSISGDSLKLSNGGYVDLSNYDNSQGLVNLLNKIVSDSSLFSNLISVNTQAITGNTSTINSINQELDFDSLKFQNKVDSINQNLVNHILNDFDTDTLNEIQLLSISNDTLYLENGGFVDLSGFKDYNNLVNKPDSLSDFVNDVGFLTNQNTSTYQVGDTAFGGVVFYVSSSGGSGLVVSLEDFCKTCNKNEASDSLSLFNRKNGSLENWREPTIDELKLILNNLQNLNLSGIYWSNSSRASSFEYYFRMVFSNTVTNGDIDSFLGSSYYFKIRAVKSFGNENIIIPENLDNDSTNEIQTISISNDTIRLTKGGEVVLPSDSQTVFVMVDNLAFIQVSGASTNRAIHELNYNYTRPEGSTNSTAYLAAPIQLPDNARIISASVWVEDGQNGFIEAEFQRHYRNSPNSGTIASNSTATYAPAQNFELPLNFSNSYFIDNQQYSYRFLLKFNFGNSNGLLHVKNARVEVKVPK